MEEILFSDFIKLPPTEQLDYILNYLNNDNLPESIDEIEKKLNWEDKPEIDKALNVIIDKLQKNEYILMKKISNPYPPYTDTKDKYYISFEGKVFASNNGYNQQDKINKINLKVNRLTTFALIFGGVAAGIYYIFELLGMAVAWVKIYYPLFPYFGH